MCRSEKEPFVSPTQKVFFINAQQNCGDPAQCQLCVDVCIQRNICFHFEKSSIKYGPVNKAKSRGLTEE